MAARRFCRSGQSAFTVGTFQLCQRVGAGRAVSDVLCCQMVGWLEVMGVRLGQWECSVGLGHVVGSGESPKDRCWDEQCGVISY